MSASCCAGAAAVAARLAPFDCFQRGLVTRRMPPLAQHGARMTDGDALWATFSVAVKQGRIEDIRFRAASCTTLVTCCQALAELNRGCRIESPCVADADALWRRLPGLPRAKQDRVLLAVGAFRSVLSRADREPAIQEREA